MEKIHIIIIISILSVFIINSQPILTLDPGGHKSVISELAFSNDEKYLITGSQDKTVKVWDIESGENIKTFRGYIDDEYQGTVNSISISPDNKYLAVGTMIKDAESNKEYLGIIRIYDFHSEKIIKVLYGHEYNINKVIFSKDGRYLASSSNDTTVNVWDVRNNFKLLHKLSFHKKGCYGISFSNNEKYIATSSFDNSIAIWDIKSGEMLASKINPHDQGVEQIEFSNDDSFVATSSTDGTIKFWNVKDLKFIKTAITFPQNSHATKMKFSPNGKYLICGGTTPLFIGNKWINPVHFFNLVKGKIEKRFEEHNNTIMALAISSSGKFIASCGGSNFEVNIYDNNLEVVQKLVSHGKTIFDVAYGNDNHSIYFGNTNIGTRYLNEQPIEKSLSLIDFTLNENPDNNYTKFYHELNGNKLYFSGELFSNKMYMGSKEIIIRGGYNTIRAFTYTPDGKYLIVGSDDVVSKFDTASGYHLGDYLGHSRFIWSVSASKDSGRILTGSWDQTMKLWDVNSKNMKFKIDKVLEGSIAEKYGLKSNDLILDVDGKIFSSHDEFLSYIAPQKKYMFNINRSGENIKKEINKNSKSFGFTFFSIEEPLATIFISNDGEYLVWTPDNYFTGNKKLFKYVGWHVNQGKEKEAKFYSFEQFALKYNRPDIILERLGYAEKEIIDAYYSLYKKRLEKMGFKESDLSGELQLPEIKIESDLKDNTTKDSKLKISYNASDSIYKLNRINFFLNDVPLFGIGGKSIKSKNKKQFSDSLYLDLVNGKNKIQVSALNEKGIESLKETIIVYCDKPFVKPDLYIATIGVSKYKDSKYNLAYSDKDANDIIDTFKKSNLYNKIYVLKVNNEDAKKENIFKINDFYSKSKVDDHVVLFIAGHGMMDDENNYYFATHDIDFKNPSKNGLAFDDIDKLLDNIPAVTKLLLMDTCFSGEVDTSDYIVKLDNDSKNGKIKTRAVESTRGLRKINSNVSKELVLLKKDIFSNLKNGTGAVVISSSGGAEYSYEGIDENGKKIENGVFTYSFIKGLNNYLSDTNKDKKIQVSEIMKWVYDNVTKLTDGKQNPTMRREKIEFDYSVF